jgi:hypothetical protein
MVGIGRIPAVTEKSEAPRMNTAVASLRSRSAGDVNGYHKVGQINQKPKMGQIGDVPGRTVRLRSAKMNGVVISDHRLPAINNGYHTKGQKQKPAKQDGCGDVPGVAGMLGLAEPTKTSLSPLASIAMAESDVATAERGRLMSPLGSAATDCDLGCSGAGTADNNPNSKITQNAATTIECVDVPAAASVRRLGFAATVKRLHSQKKIQQEGVDAGTHLLPRNSMSPLGSVGI